VGFRAPRELKETLEEAATNNRRSMSTEAQFRLNQSFAEEIAYGGPEMRRIVYLMASAFGHSGAMEAAASGHPDWKQADWIKDRDCFRSAMTEVLKALAAIYPGGFTSADLDLMLERFRSSMAGLENNREPFGRQGASQ
jgi:hypothetical protein